MRLPLSPLLPGAPTRVLTGTLASTLACAVAGTALVGCGTEPATTSPAPHDGPAMATHSPEPTGAPVVPSESASLTPHPVTDVQSTPPVSLGNETLAPDEVTAEGFAAVQPTPEELQDREFTLPDTVPELPGDGFTARVEPAPAAVLARSSWTPRCAVGADQLDRVRLTFVGFDHERHTGELLVRRSISRDVVAAFRELWRERFPIEEMTIKTADEVAHFTGDDNDTSAFECRPGEKPTPQSQGLAVDVDPFQNPATKEAGDTSLIRPALAGAYLDRGWDRPGMIAPGGPVVRAFRGAGFTWGGTEEPAHFEH